MRVLHVISDQNIGGAGVLLLNLLRWFDKERVESIVALPAGSLLTDAVASTGVGIVPLMHPCDRLSPAAVCELVGWIRRENIELVHANAALAARLAGRLTGTHVVHTRHCCFPPHGLLKSSMIRAAAGAWNRVLSDRVIATAEAAADNLRMLGVHDRQMRVIINGSAPVRELDARELADARARWEIDEDDYCIGICARLVPCKGHGSFLQAAAEVIQRFPNRSFCFLVAGEGEEAPALRELADRLGIAKHVRFLGFLEDTAAFYRLLRINVNCSVGTETSCLAISEGMSASVPCVVADYGGNPAMIGKGDAGILYPAGDSRALAEALSRIISDETQERHMRLSARERYLQCFTAERMANEVAGVYEELVPRPTAAVPRA